MEQDATEKPMELKNKRVLVVGLGRSGVSSAIFLQEHGAKVIVSDSKAEAQLQSEVSALLDRGISIETGRHGERTFRDQDLIVVSPGVPSDQPQLQHARTLGIPVIGEVELAFRFLKGKVLAITGSNGKTTTTTLVGEILAKSGKKTLVGGNIGTPVISLAGQSTPDTMVVLEVSSFQLESIEQFCPWIAAILNITPDHLDRHHTFEAYVAAKARIFEKQQATDFAVLNADDPTCVALKDKVKGSLLWFSRKQRVENGAFVDGDQIVFRQNNQRQNGQEQPVLSRSDIQLKGEHNLENVLAAVAMTMVAGCTPQQVQQAVKEFRAVEHRLELVATINGVTFYNDSKATNVDATVKALESFPAVARAIVSNGARQAKKNPHDLLAPPSAQVIESAETAFVSDRQLTTDTNRLQHEGAQGSAGIGGLLRRPRIPPAGSGDRRRSPRIRGQ